MKTSVVILTLFLFLSNVVQSSNTQEVKSSVTEVTVFIEGAQISREKNVPLQQGVSILKFTGLSPFVDAKSVQVNASGALTIMSVNFQKNYIESAEKDKEASDLHEKVGFLEDQIERENVGLEIIRERLSFLKENKEIGGRNQELSVSNLKEAANYFGSSMQTIRMQEYETLKKINDLKLEVKKIKYQLNIVSGKTEYPSGEIFVKVDAKSAGKAKFGLSYVVANAGWFPSYDIRANSITEPIELIYKANVYQNTKIEWKDVKLKFSSANPNVSGVAPELKPYYLGYNTRPPVYNRKINSVSGTIFDSKGDRLPGATVMVEGTTIGTVSDMNGAYEMTLPNSARELKFSFIGFETQTLPIRNPVLNVRLKESRMELQEVMVAGASSRINMDEALQGRMAGVQIKKSKPIRIRGKASIPVETRKENKQTTVSFEIKKPYSIKSDGRSYVVDMEVYSLPAMFQYYCVPKIDRDAFLIAHIMDWEKYNLLEGEANLFFEKTFVGKSLLDVKSATDTLQISLGRDKNISVTWEKNKAYSKKQLLGSKKIDERAWKTVIKNNKPEDVNILVIDQIPVSVDEEIEVEAIDVSGAKLDSETGELRWILDIKSNKSKDISLRYKVRYSKNKTVYIE